MAAAGSSLQDLADLAVGTAEVGSVNFSALHTLLHAIIQHLHIQHVGIEVPGGPYPPPGGLVKDDGQQGRMNYLPLPLGGSSAVEDKWKMVQLTGRLEVTEEGVSKAMTVLQDLMLEINALKDSQCEIQNQIQKVTETSGLKELEEKFEVLHETLARHTETSYQPRDNDSSRTSGPTHNAEISVSDGPSQAEDSSHPVDATSMPQKIGINPSMTSMNTTAAPGLPGVTSVLPNGVTSKEHAMLYTRLDALERDKADHVELGLLQKNTDDLAMTLCDLQEKLRNLNSEMQDLRGDTDELDELQTTIESMGTAQHSDQKLEEPSLSATIEEIEKELKELRKRQKREEATNEQSADDTPLYLQNQAGELIEHIQKTVSQLQEECDRLTRATGSLIQDHERKQQHINILYQTLENLDKKKVDKELTGLNVDMKADKHALEGNVSRAHFDATTEHLSNMVQELLGKVSAQEQDWQRLLENINVEMQNKLDRIELEPLKNILEQCWRDLRRQLQENPPQYEADEAAGIRKQLMKRFHCISCDRPVDMMVPGSEILTIPNIPGLPAHRSNRPYTVFELDQIRQQSRSDRFPQLSDFGYMSSFRNCGGSHTLTFPQRRFARLQPCAPCAVQKEDFVGGLKEEVFILGEDGHIYRGRRDNSLPTIKTKDDKRLTFANQKICDSNLKGEENFFGCSDIHYGLSKAQVKSARGSEQALPSIKDSLPPTCYQSTKAT